MTTHTEAPPIYEMVTDKPQTSAAYMVRDFATDPTVDIKDEARRCASLPGVRTASVEYDWSGLSRLRVVSHSGETLTLNAGEWLVVRHLNAGPHPLDAARCFERDVTGQFMAYTDTEYHDRYQ